MASIKRKSEWVVLRRTTHSLFGLRGRKMTSFHIKLLDYYEGLISRYSITLSYEKTKNLTCVV